MALPLPGGRPSFDLVIPPVGEHGPGSTTPLGGGLSLINDSPLDYPWTVLEGSGDFAHGRHFNVGSVEGTRTFGIIGTPTPSNADQGLFIQLRSVSETSFGSTFLALQHTSGHRTSIFYETASNGSPYLRVTHGTNQQEYRSGFFGASNRFIDIRVMIQRAFPQLRVSASEPLNLTNPDPGREGSVRWTAFISTAPAVIDEISLSTASLYGLKVWNLGEPQSTGMWATRQRQNPAGNAGGYPLRQRQNAGATGAWPLRQRQNGM